MKIVGKELADSARARSDIYGLLATVFREEPTEALIMELRGPRFSGVFSDMEVDMGKEFYSAPDAELRESLVLEFTELFIGPRGHISAHESVFVEADSGVGGLWGAKTVEVKNFIESTGLKYESRFTGIPDHVSVELEFMQKLTGWESDKWINGDRKGAEYCQSVQIMFLQQHLLVWLPELCDAVVKQAKLPFYRAMAELTNSFMEYEKQNTRVNKAA